MADDSTLTTDDGRPIPRATYRLQLTAAFGFAQAAALAPYLTDLGISHVYTSSYLRARPGSTHGYDIVSHSELNPELGSDADFARMVAAFRAHGLGQVLDFVPNHMGVGGADNPWWLDVLEWGSQSEFAAWFDIDWQPEHRYLHETILVPFLGDQYGAVLASGALRLRFEPQTGTFSVWAYDEHRLPVTPPHYPRILGHEHPELERLGDAFGHLPAWRPHLRRRAAELKAELAAAVARDPEVAAAVQRAVDRFAGEPGDLESWSRLHALIEEQHWRPAYFRAAADDINYRRFFNVNDLAGVRMELPELFAHAHALVFELVADGVLDGLRLDHVDGLLDPKGYCLRLRARSPRPVWVVAEKILAPHESLREDWDIEGTTGYECAALVTGLLVDPAGEEPLTRLHAQFTGNERPFGEIVRECKRRIMENEMASELNVLARDAARVARSNPLTADFTNNAIRRALQQIIACFPVYRTYVDGDPPSEADRRDIDWALAQARRMDPALEPSVFDFLHGLMTCDLVAQPRSGFSRVAVTRVAMRVQQYSGPVMAKGLEDTALYRYGRLLALNEVGSYPDRFGVSVAAFHHANQQRAKRTPHAMLSTSTHDSKRGEDARARLAVLSEIPDEWAQQVAAWSRLLRAPESGASEPLPPDREDEYAFYQMLLGAWPAELAHGEAPDAGAIDGLRTRIEGAMVKAMREAKLHTNWMAPDSAYEDATLAFVRHALDASRPQPFLEAFAGFAARAAELGMRNSLVQTVLRLTAPGVPDVYQGAELWNLSLVDPDNRRPVDFARRQAMLSSSEPAPAGGQGAALQALLRSWHDGRVKLVLLQHLLQLRRAFPALLAQGGYEPLQASGDDGERICAFARAHDGVTMVVAVLRFPARGPAPAACVLALPGEAPEGPWLSVFDGRTLTAADGQIAAATLFPVLPVAVLLGGDPARLGACPPPRARVRRERAAAHPAAGEGAR